MTRWIPVVALLFAASSSPSLSQSLPAKGAEATLDVATWNIEHFGNDGLAPPDGPQIEKAAAIIRQSAVDLFAVQEIEDGADFAALIDKLGDGWAGQLDQASSNLKLGFIYKTDVIRPRRIGNELTQFASEFAGRPPFQMEAEVTLPDTSLIVTFITLHMKAFNDQRSYDRRKAASGRLKNHIDFTTLSTKPVVVLGDLNDRLTTSITAGRTSPYENFVADTSNFSFTTLDLERNGTNTFCFTARCASGSTIDHILITDELYGAYIAGSAGAYDEVFDADASYLSSTSDHLPVFSRFRFGQHTSTEKPSALGFRLQNVYPNPLRGAAYLDFEIAVPGAVIIEMTDLLGRTVRTLDERFFAAGRHTERIDLDGLATGIYLMRFHAGGQRYVKSLVVVR